MPLVRLLADVAVPGSPGVVYGAGHEIDVTDAQAIAMRRNGKAELLDPAPGGGDGGGSGSSHITNLVATPGRTTCTITWTTDVQSDSYVGYGIANPDQFFKQDNTQMVLSHSLTLTPLQPATTYQYYVRSMAGGVWATSTTKTFTTTP